MKRLERKNTAEFNIFGSIIVLMLIALTMTVVVVVKNQNASYAVAAGSCVYDIDNVANLSRLRFFIMELIPIFTAINPLIDPLP